MCYWKIYVTLFMTTQNITPNFLPIYVVTSLDCGCFENYAFSRCNKASLGTRCMIKLQQICYVILDTVSDLRSEKYITLSNTLKFNYRYYLLCIFFENLHMVAISNKWRKQCLYDSHINPILHMILQYIFIKILAERSSKQSQWSSCNQVSIRNEAPLSLNSMTT